MKTFFQFRAFSKLVYDPEKISSSKYYDIEIPHKNKLLSLFHINACSLDKNLYDFQHLLSCTKTKFDITAISEIRITKQVSLSNNFNLNNYSFEFTPTETYADGTHLHRMLPFFICYDR